MHPEQSASLLPLTSGLNQENQDPCAAEQWGSLLIPYPAAIGHPTADGIIRHHTLCWVDRWSRQLGIVKWDKVKQRRKVHSRA